MRDRNFIASIEHGLSVLEALSNGKREMPLATLAEEVKLQKTTTWRIAHTLVDLGYLRQDPESRRFALASRVMSLGYAYFDGLELKQLAQPFLLDLSRRVGETVAMAILDGDELLYIERIKTNQVVNINLHVGSRLPLYNTSMGRVLLSEMSPSAQRQYLNRLKHIPEAKKFCADDLLLKLVKETQKRGYALNDQEFVVGLRSIAAAVRVKSGGVAAVINISVPSARASAAQLQRTYAPELLKTANEISTALGFRAAR